VKRLPRLVNRVRPMAIFGKASDPAFIPPGREWRG